MPRNPTTGVFTRVSNTFSNPVFGTLIDPTDAIALFDDQDVGLNPPILAGPLTVTAPITIGVAGTTAGTAVFLNATSGSITLTPPTGALGTRTLTLPVATDTLVGKATTDTLTNKTLTSPVLSPSATIAMGADTGTGLLLTGLAGNGRLVLGADSANGVVRSANAGQLKFGIDTTDSAALESAGLFSLGVASATAGKLKLYGATSGSITVQPTAIAGTSVLTLPAETGTLVTGATTKTLTNTTFDTAGSGNSFSINGVAVTANTGTGAVARAAAPTFTTPVLGSASATNLAFSPSTGGIVGTATNDSANAGIVGELISSTIASGSAVALTTATQTNITSISLTAGDWDVQGFVTFTGGATTTLTHVDNSVSTTSATLETASDRRFSGFYNGGTVFNTVNLYTGCGASRFSLASTTTVFLVARASFGTSTCSAFGTIRARRVR